MNIKLLLVDLDGTIREPASDNTFINQPNDQQLISGVSETLARYQDWTIIGITNQGGVASGHKSLQDAILEQKVTLRLCPQLQAIYFCPNYDGLECWKVDREQSVPIKQFSTDEFGSFRKPGAGMLNLAIRQFEAISNRLYVGDREEDKQAAFAISIPFMWAADWRQR